MVDLGHHEAAIAPPRQRPACEVQRQRPLVAKVLFGL